MKKFTKDFKHLEKVKVVWIDIIQTNGWTSTDEIIKKDPMECASLGFLLYEDEKKLIIVDTISADSDASYNVFPKGCIVSVEKLTKSRRK